MTTFQFNSDGLIPVIAQEASTNEVLMLAWMNQDAIDQTLKTKYAHYYSRSRQQLWKKGETSGNVQKVKSFSYDCDADAILLKVEQTGVACHTEHKTCFYRDIFTDDVPDANILDVLFNVIKERKAFRPEGSYTTYLFDKGVDKILKKVGEETSEVIIAAKNNNDELIYEASDLIYHLLVLLVNNGVELSDIYKELASRR